MTSLLGSKSVCQYGHRSAWRPSSRSTARSCNRSVVVRAEKSKQKVVAVLYKAGKAAENKDLLGCVENELGLRQFLEEQGHEYIVTDDKEGDDSELDKHLKDANILISTPFHPAYLTKERIDKAKHLKLSITAGVGSDHIDLHAAADGGMTVAEVTGSNVVSVAEHVIMLILSLVRNYLPAHKQITDGGWDIGAAASTAYDLENKVVGTVGTGRIGQLVLARLKPAFYACWYIMHVCEDHMIEAVPIALDPNKDIHWLVQQPFDCAEVLYFDYKHLDENKEKELGCKFAEMDDLIKKCDVITVNLPLTDKTKNMFNKEMLGKMKKGAFLVNTARGGICERDAIVEALESGQLGGYAGDVWNPQPPPEDHPWRTMPNHGMTPHYSGTTLDAQARYADGTKKMLQNWFDEEDFPKEWYIVREGELADQYK